MKVAFAHDFIRHGGAERVLEAMVKEFPSSAIHTLLAERHAHHQSWDVRSSWLQPFLPAKLYRWPMALYPGMIDRMSARIDQDIDLLISSSVSYTKNLKAPPGVPHLCMMYRPAIFAYERQDNFMTGYPRVLHPFLRKLADQFRRWDQENTKHADALLACSQYVASKIRTVYQRDAEVIYPPVQIDPFREAQKNATPADYFLCASRLESYKRVDLVIDACNQRKLPLKIVGTGPMRAELQRRAGPTIDFLGFVSSTKLPKLVAECKAFVFPSEEDFGIAPVEALAAGRPVVAYGRAGALETITDGETGLHFAHQEPESLLEALERLDSMEFDSQNLLQSAERFSERRFQSQFLSACESAAKIGK